MKIYIVGPYNDPDKDSKFHRVILEDAFGLRCLYTVDREELIFMDRNMFDEFLDKRMKERYGAD